MSHRITTELVSRPQEAIMLILIDPIPILDSHNYPTIL
jgi:hypothetical protein